MGKVNFEKFVRNAEILNPIKDFELDRQRIEHRVDPLTGHLSVVRGGRKELSWLFANDEKLISELAEKSKERCFFCPEKIVKGTPMFPNSLIPGGRFSVGEAWLFPNLFAHKEFSAVVVLSKKHFLRPEEFTVELLFNGLTAALFYIRRVYEKYSHVKHAEIGCNYLFPAGSSVMHPHIQPVMSDIPCSLVKELLKYGRSYWGENSVNYWRELVEAEKDLDERYIGRVGGVEFYTPFAPFGEDEIHGVILDKSNFLELDETDLRSLAEGLSRILKVYADKNILSFNFGLFSGPLGEKLDWFSVGLRVTSRRGVQANYVNDVWFSLRLFQDGYVTEPPEEVAKFVKVRI